MGVLTEQMKRRIAAYVPRYPSKQAVTLPALQIVQEELRCVPLAAMEEIASMLDLHPAEVQDTASFYGFFRDERRPLGRHRVWVCRSLPCMLLGGEELLANLCAQHGIQPGDTTADGKLTIELAECLGACEGAPCMLVDEECRMDVTLQAAADALERLS